jgi:Icc-related predicted phosphoesterase
MRILFGSDFHGLREAFDAFSVVLRDGQFDCGVIAGDLMTHFSPGETDRILIDAGMSKDDLIEELGGPDETQPTPPADQVFKIALYERATNLQKILIGARKPVFFIMGNDDGIVGGGLEWQSVSAVENINQRVANFGGKKLVGYQYTPPFVGGLFEKTEEQQEQDMQHLSRLVDRETILVTHGPPRGILDGEGFGGVALRKLVDTVKPKLHLFGHIHQSAGIEWPFINGAFPQNRAFVSIDVELRQATLVPVDDHR